MSLKNIKRTGWGLLILLILWSFNALLSKRYPAPSIMGHSLHSVEKLAKDRIRVASWNIHTGKGTDKKRDIDRIKKTLMQAGPFDIIGLQEVSGPGYFAKDSQADYLAKQLGLNSIFAPTEYRWLKFNQGNALLTSQPVSDYRTIPLPYLSTSNSQTSRGRSYRNLLLSVLPHQTGDIGLLTTHLDTSHLNKMQLKLTFDTFSELCARYSRCILMADLNNEHTSQAVPAYIKQYHLTDATEITARQYQGRNVDWILTKGLNLVDSGFVDKGPSDHGLFWADLELP